MNIVEYGSPFVGGEIFEGLRRLQEEVHGLFEQRTGWLAGGAYPPINVWGDDQAVMLEAQLPGMELKDIDLSVTGDTVMLRGERRGEPHDARETYHRQERRGGRFSRLLRLPFRVRADQVEATYRKGILRLRLPRVEEDRAKKITVQAA